jgi:Ran GTPase-activating protein (RanGAP) involved in mRNA processing and transport
LETLHLGDNKFTEVGVKLLAEWLETSSSLEKLFLNDNEMGQEGVSYISEALVCNKSIKFLSIAACGIIDDTFKPMLASLSVNETLESLHVWGNFLTLMSAELIIEVLRKHNHVLNDLQLFNNPIEDYEMIKVVRDK